MSEKSFFRKAAKAIADATHVIIGAGAGLSEASGIEMGGHLFHEQFRDYQQKYGIQDLYSGGFYPFPTEEEHWAFWARHIWLSRYKVGGTPLHRDLLALVKDKSYFVISTNCDSQFVLSGFPEDRVFQVQGDLSEFQCSIPCHQKVYRNEDAVKRMVETTHGFRIPSDLLPRCPVCGKPMSMHLRMDNTFVEDETWHERSTAYREFLEQAMAHKPVLLELGVGFNTPGIIRYPFERIAAANPEAMLIRVNQENAEVSYIDLTNILSIQEDLKVAIDKLKHP